MSNNKTIWCIIKKYVVGTLVSAALFGLGYTAYHIITSEPINAQQTTDIIDIEDEVKQLSDKIDKTQPAKIEEQIKNLKSDYETLEGKIDYYELKQYNQNLNMMSRQDKMYDLLLKMHTDNP